MGIVSPAMIEAYGRYGISEQPGGPLGLASMLGRLYCGRRRHRIAGMSIHLLGRLQSVKIVENFNDQIMNNLNFSNTKNVLSK